MTKRILHVFGCMNRGGAEMRTVSLMQSMQDKGVVFDFCVLSGQQGVLDEQIRALGGRIYYCKLGIGFIPRFCTLLRQQQFTGVHSHVAYVSGFIVMLAWLAGVSLRITHFRNTTDGATQSFFRATRNRLLKAMIGRFSTHILAVCHGAMQGFWGTDWQHDLKCKVIYNGFELPVVPAKSNFWQSYLPGYQEQKIIVNVARMDVQKNHLRQCQIFIELLKQQPDSVMVFIGKEDPSRKAVMTELIERHGITDKVCFLGLQTNVLAFMYHADVLLFPSLWEGLPGVVLEASSVGLPVVASDLSGIEEIAQQISSVKICSLASSDNVWAQQLAELITTPIEKNQVIEQFRHSDFLLANNVDALYAVYSA